MVVLSMEKIIANPEAQAFILDRWKAHAGYMDYKVAKKTAQLMRPILKVRAIDVLGWVGQHPLAKQVA